MKAKAKPIISTPVMKLDAAATEYWSRAGAPLCVDELGDIFDFDACNPPRRIRLHAHQRPARSRHAIHLDMYGSDCIDWGTTRGRMPESWFDAIFEAWLWRKLRAAGLWNKGSILTLYVSLEIVEAGK